MRLNFSGVNEDEIREGVRRLGEVVREQVALYSTLGGQPAAGTGGGAQSRANPSGAGLAEPAPAKTGSSDRDALAQVLPLTRKRAG